MRDNISNTLNVKQLVFNCSSAILHYYHLNYLQNQYKNNIANVYL